MRCELSLTLDFGLDLVYFQMRTLSNLTVIKKLIATDDKCL